MLIASTTGFAACDLARFLDPAFVNDRVLLGAMQWHGLFSTSGIDTPIANRRCSIAPRVEKLRREQKGQDEFSNSHARPQRGSVEDLEGAQ
jgi:hypothetical protein